jgi:ABC-type nickel/cobalt efflux system permease component RcnA
MRAVGVTLVFLFVVCAGIAMMKGGAPYLVLAGAFLLSAIAIAYGLWRTARSSARRFRLGDSVRYVPYHAKGNLSHEDCEDGRVSGIEGDGTVFVKFNGPNSTAKGCRPDQLWNFRGS